MYGNIWLDENIGSYIVYNKAGAQLGFGRRSHTLEMVKSYALNDYRGWFIRCPAVNVEGCELVYTPEPFWKTLREVI